MDSRVYRHVLVRYIDFNAVRAGLVGVPQDYPYASAWFYQQPNKPIWLERSWI